MTVKNHLANNVHLKKNPYVILQEESDIFGHYLHPIELLESFCPVLQRDTQKNLKFKILHCEQKVMQLR